MVESWRTETDSTESIDDRTAIGELPRSVLGGHDDEPLSISVVMAAYTEDRWDSIVAGVASVLSQCPPPLEVILAVDHNPRLLERARKELRGVTVVENTGPRGASAARNSGVAHSRGRLLVFVDDDQAAKPGWLGSLCGHFSDPDVLGVGGGISLAWPERRPRWFVREFDWAVGGSYTGMPEVVTPTRNVWSGNMAIPRAVFDAVDGFRAGFGKQGASSSPEDTDLCLRVRSAFPSGHWLYDPSAQITHIVPSERTTRRFFLGRCWSEGRGKASLARLNGIDASTVSERRYVTRVLPKAFVRELSRGVLRADIASLDRAGAILLGTLYTIAGFLTASLVRGRFREFGARAVGGKRANGITDDGDPLTMTASGFAPKKGASFRPITIAQWDVLNPLPAIPSGGSTSEGGRASILIRLGTEPLGRIDVNVESFDSLADAVVLEARSLLSPISTRLVASGLPPIDQIPVDGLQIDADKLSFVTERKRLLENAPAISVVVCTHDRPERIADCVSRLAGQEYPNYEIIVVDNAPSDPEAVPTALASLNVPVPLRYMLEVRPGLSRARNTGWRKAYGQIIAFVDDDVIVDTHWLAEILRGFSARPKVGCVTGVVLPAELRTQSQLWFEEFGGFAKGRGFSQEVFAPGHPQSPLYPLPQFGSGANMAFSREVLEDIEGFNVSLGGGTPTKGSEDTYAFSRTLLAKHTLVYQPTALVWHYHRDTFDDLRVQLHGYGLATTAFYGALLRHDLKLLVPILRLIPTAVRDMFKTDSIRTAEMETFPRSLLRAELLGMLTGFPIFVYNETKRTAREAIHARRSGEKCGER